jgi:hypothetical protein
LRKKKERKEFVVLYTLSKQVLEAVIGPYYALLSLEEQEKFIFIEDGAKVY